MASGTILIVEDDAEVRASLSAALELHGVQVVTAQDGIEGLERLRGEPTPSVILLDLRLPRLGGDEFLSAMRADPRFENVPVITMTCGVDSTPDHEVIAKLRKPFDVADLLEIVLSLFEASAA